MNNMSSTVFIEQSLASSGSAKNSITFLCVPHEVPAAMTPVMQHLGIIDQTVACCHCSGSTQQTIMENSLPGKGGEGLKATQNLYLVGNDLMMTREKSNVDVLAGLHIQSGINSGKTAVVAWKNLP